MSLNLNNKLALITGAANGIGLATANLFASRGADLALADLSIDLKKVVKDLEAKYPNRVITAHIYDLTSSSNVENLYDEIQQSHANYQHPTILVNSAGIGRKKSYLEIDEIEYDKMMDINFKGTFLVTQGLIRRLIANYPNVNFTSPVESYASIVNVSSIVGKNGGPGFTFHSITKPGVDGFSKSVAKEFGDRRIRCNAVLPFFIESQSLESEINFERKEFLKGLPALKRFGEAEEVADVVYFLASDASSFITGTTIEVNGGF